MAQQQHNVRLVNGQNPPPQHLLSAAAANGGVSFKFGGNGGLESVHERNNGVIQYSSLKIKVRFYFQYGFESDLYPLDLNWFSSILLKHHVKHSFTDNFPQILK